MIIDTLKGRAFIHVPKCGGTTIRNQLNKVKGIKIINEAHKPFEFYHVPLSKYKINEFVCFLRHPVDWFLSFYGHAKFHGIHGEYVSKGFDFFIENYIYLYNYYIKNQIPLDCVIIDLHDMNSKMKSIGYNINMRSNVTTRTNIITQKNYDAIMIEYRHLNCSLFNMKAVIGINKSIEEKKLSALSKEKNHFRIKR